MILSADSDEQQGTRCDCIELLKLSLVLGRVRSMPENNCEKSIQPHVQTCFD